MRDRCPCRDRRAACCRASGSACGWPPRSGRACSRRAPPARARPCRYCRRRRPCCRPRTVWPKVVRESWSAIRRLTVSVPPPGANGTIQRIGLLGHALWARAMAGADRAAARSMRLFMAFPRCSSFVGTHCARCARATPAPRIIRRNAKESATEVARPRRGTLLLNEFPGGTQQPDPRAAERYPTSCDCGWSAPSPTPCAGSSCWPRACSPTR